MLWGEDRDVRLVNAAIAREVANRDRPFCQSPWLFLFQAERRRSVRARVKAAATRISAVLSPPANRRGQWHCRLSADTDGIDRFGRQMRRLSLGPDNRWTTQGQRHGPLASLATNDAWTAFNAIDDLLWVTPGRPVDQCQMISGQSLFG